MIRTYVRLTHDGKYAYCKVDDADRRFDIEQGFMDADKVPEYTKINAAKLRGFFPSYVEITS